MLKKDGLPAVFRNLKLVDESNIRVWSIQMLPVSSFSCIISNKKFLNCRKNKILLFPFSKLEIEFKSDKPL